MKNSKKEHVKETAKPIKITKNFFRKNRYVIDDIENVIENNENINWNDISKYQILTMNFIRKYQDKVNWKFISIHQGKFMTETFIEEFADKIHWRNLCLYNSMRMEFIRKHLDKINYKNICIQLDPSDIEHLRFTMEFDSKIAKRDKEKKCKYWAVGGQYHRLIGPAIIYDNGKKEWYYKGDLAPVTSQEEFESWLNLQCLNI